MKRLAVYCGSATPEDPIYIDTARSVGRGLAERGIGVVYGGGRLGLMGAVADSALEAGGEVIGIIPEALVGAEVAHKGCTELHVVSGMHERKARFTDLSDGFITTSSAGTTFIINGSQAFTFVRATMGGTAKWFEVRDLS